MLVVAFSTKVMRFSSLVLSLSVTKTWAELVASVTVTPAITVFSAVPLTVIASASSVPSISASPDISKLVASTSPATVRTPLATVIKSVSPVCPMVDPLIITLSTVKVVNVPTDVRLGIAVISSSK